MDKLREKIRENFKKSLIKEERKLPSDAYIESCPSIYKAIRPSHLESYIKNGFNNQLAGDGGIMRGYGVYSSLELEGGIYRSRAYGNILLRGKVLGGFKNYIMFDGDRSKAINKQIIKYYGANLSYADQIKSIVSDPNDAQILINAGYRLNGDWHGDNPATVKLINKYGIRGMIYMDGVATTLPFDFSTVILWEYAKNVSGYDSPNDVKLKMSKNKVFDENARARYELTLDWDSQLKGRYESFDKNKITKVASNNEVYALVKDYRKGGYNFVQIDTSIAIHLHPHEISNIWYKNEPTLPSLETGIFRFNYNNFTFFATVFQKDINGPAIWFPDEEENMLKPDINYSDGWYDLSMDNLNEIYGIVRNRQSQHYSLVEGKNLKNIFRKQLNKIINEEITDKDENEFVTKHRCYVYRATRPSGFESIFNYGQLRQFAGSNDGSWYGEGVYSVVRPEDVQYGKYDKETRSGGVKMIVLGGYNRFLIFEEVWAKKVYGSNWQIKDQFYTLFPKEVADNIMIDYNNWLPRTGSTNLPMVKCTWNFGNGTRTTGFLHYIFDNGHLRTKYTNLFSKYNIRGTIYVGGNDGLTALCWNFDQVIPYQYTTDKGRTWHSDLFNFQLAKERSFKNTDPVSKFRHLYKYISDNIVQCNINGEPFNVTSIRENNGKWNIININDPKGRKISPVDFDSEPIIGLNGIFKFFYQGIPLYGTVRLPETKLPSLWFSDTNFNSRPTYENNENWYDLSVDNILEICDTIKNQNI